MSKKSVKLIEEKQRENDNSKKELLKNESEIKFRKDSQEKKDIYIQQKSVGGYSYFINFLVLVCAVLAGMLIQQTGITSYLSNLNRQQESVKNEPFIDSKQGSRVPSPFPFDMDLLYKEMSEKLKKEMIEYFKASNPNIIAKSNKNDELINEDVNNESKNVVINDKLLKDQSESDQIKFAKNNEPIVIDAKNLKLSPESNSNEKRKKENKENKEEAIERKKKHREAMELKKKAHLEIKEKNLKKESSQNIKIKESETKLDSSIKVPDEVKNFVPTKISSMKTKKMWIPIPNSNGGHRRVPAIEVKAGKNHGSSVKIWLYEEFFSQEECESLIKAHESHLVSMLNQKPIICFDSVSTLKKNLIELKREKIADLVTPLDFTEGTMCLNVSFSRQLEKWGLKWSFSTAFYPGESKFSKIFGKRIEEATMLNETHGGKFQITSYPFEVGYKDHTDCVLDSNEERDRYATFLVYLNDMGADGGGETLFPEMGIDVKPRQGRALTWNNMNYQTGKCEPASKHRASKIKHVTKKKYIIQRWYYYKNFFTLGKRTTETLLPERPENTPKVSCDNYDSGSCRLYDEWNPDHLINKRLTKEL